MAKKTAMKIGFQTIVWGPRVRNLEYMLDVITAAGYQGVELFQRPEVLGSIDRILRLLEERQLNLIGLSGGSLTERMEFCGKFRPVYLYMDMWNEEEACEAMDKGFTLGLHPHAFMPVGDLAEARKILDKYPQKEYPELMFIPDTAHLSVTHDDPIRAIRENNERIVSVHLKDWSPEFGRSSFRYARGFVGLGEGSVDLDAVLDVLKELKYKQWIVVEQDYTLTDPDMSTFTSAKWLAKKGILSKLPQRKSVQVGLRASKGRETCPLKNEILFSRQISRARLQRIEQWYESIAIAFRKLVPSKLVEVWTSAPKQDIMSLVATKPDNINSIKTFIPQHRDILSGITVERKAITHYDLTNQKNAERFVHQELITKLNLKKMVSLPIFNPWNFHHMRLIVNIFPSDGKVIPNDDELFRASANVSFALDAALEDICSASATKVNFEAGRCEKVKDFLNALVELVKTTIKCEGVAIFLVNEEGDKLELKNTTGTTWMVKEDDRFYRKGEGLTGWVWENRQTFLTFNAFSEPICKHKSFEGTESYEDDDCLFVPLSKTTGEVIGVVRCRKKSVLRALGKSEISLFSDDDAAILEAIAQSAIPHLELMFSQEQLEKALGDMKTSLRVLGHETKQLNFGLERVRRDYLADVGKLQRLSGHRANIICRDIEGYFKQIDFLFTQTRMLVTELPKPNKKYFWAYTELLFKWEYIYRLEAEHKSLQFDIHHPWESDPERPPVYGDKVQLDLLLYNLISNAVKYCGQGTKIKIECKKLSKKKNAPHVLSVTNYGREFQCKNPFNLGERGSNVVGIEGIGIGLYNANRIADAHKAQFEYECNKISDFNIPIIEAYLTSSFDDKEMALCKRLQPELESLKKSKQYEDVVARNRFGLRLYQPAVDELIDLINVATWRTSFKVTIPAKGS